MTDASHATPGPIPPPPRSTGHGCLWGCLIAAVIAIVAIVGAFSYGGWWLYSGFKNDPSLLMTMGTVNSDGIARSVLGDNIVITHLDSSNFSTTLATGKTLSFVAHLKGSKGEGTLAGTVETPPGGRTHITVLTLTGPDGRKYDLTTNHPVPGSI